MAFGVRIFVLIFGILLFFIIFELVRRRKFREELSVLWLLIGIVVIFSSFADRIVDPIAHRLGFGYPPALVFVVISFLLVIALLYFSIVVSELKGQNKELSQKMALMEYKLNKLKREN